MTYITAFCFRCKKEEEVVSMAIDDKGISMKLVCVILYGRHSMHKPRSQICEEVDDDDSYMVTGLRNGYRTTLVRDLSYEEAKDLKTRLNRNNAYVNASIAPQGKVAVNENIPIDDIIREWRMR